MCDTMQGIVITSGPFTTAKDDCLRVLMETPHVTAHDSPRDQEDSADLLMAKPSASRVTGMPTIWMAKSRSRTMRQMSRHC